MKISKLGMVLAILAVVLVFVVVLSDLAKAAEYEVNFTAPARSIPMPQANLVVRTAKYDPYPVSAGDYFDIWIKVENIGESDANDVRFQLLSEYPFTPVDAFSNNYGIIPGKVTAAQNLRPDEAKSLDNQIILKYRVKVADSAPEGTSTLKLALPVYGTNGTLTTGQTFNLPITVKKTKTDFQIISQEVSARKATFAITNIGQNQALAVTVSVEDETGIVSGEKTTVIGNMDPGDFTAISVQLLPNKQAGRLKFMVSYTDTAGIRNNVENNVPVNIDTYPPAKTANTPSGFASFVEKYMGWLLILAGLVIGIVLGAIAMKRPKKKAHEKQ